MSATTTAGDENDGHDEHHYSWDEDDGPAKRCTDGAASGS